MTQAIELGSVYEKIEVRDETGPVYEKHKGNVAKFEKDVQKKMKAMGDQFTETGRSMSIGLTAPLTLLGVTALNTASSFDEITVGTAAIAKASGYAQKDIEAMEDSVLEFTKKGIFGMEEVALAVDDMVKDGLDPAIVATSQLPAVFNLAAASGEDMAQTQVALSDAMQAFGADTDEAMKYADVFANFLNETPGSLTEFQDALKPVGPIAASNSISIEDLSGAMVALAQNGIRGSDAGNSLKRVLTNLFVPTSNMAKVMDELGVTAYDSAGNTRPLVDIMGDLAGAYEGATDEQQNLIAATIGGAYGQTSLNVLMNEGVDALKGYISSMEKTGTASQIAEDRQKGLSATMKRMEANAQVAMLTLGDAMAPIIEDIASKLIPMVQEAVEWFEKLPAPMKKGIIMFVGLLAIIGPVLVVIGSVIGALSNLVPIIGTVVGVATTLISIFGLWLIPIGLVVAALVGFGVWLATTLVKSEEFKDKIVGVFEIIKTKVQEAIQVLIGMFQLLIGAFTGDVGMTKAGGDTMKEMFGDTDSVNAIIEAISEFGKSAKEMADFAIEVFTKVKEAIILVGEKVQQYVTPMLEKLKPIIENIRKQFSKAFVKLLPTLKFIGKLLLIVIGAFIVVAAIIIGVVIVAIVALVVIFAKIIEVLGIVINAVIDFVKRMIKTYQELPEKIGVIVENIKQWFENMKEGIKDKFNQAVDAVILFVHNVILWFKELPERIATFISELVTNIVYWFGYMSVWLPNKVKEINEAVIKWFMELPSKVGATLIALWETTKTKFTEIKDSIITKVKEIIASVVVIFSELPGKVGAWLSVTKDTATTKFEETKTSVIEKTKELIEKVVEWFKGLPEKIAEGLKNLWADMKEKFVEAKDSLKIFMEEWAASALQWGKDLATNFVAGVKDKIAGLGDVFSRGQEDANQYIESHSPPKKGPWKNIDKFGYNIGTSWAEGIAQGMSMLNTVQPSASGFDTKAGQGDVALGGGKSNTFTQNITDNIIDESVYDRLKTDIMSGMSKMLGEEFKLSLMEQTR